MKYLLIAAAFIATAVAQTIQDRTCATECQPLIEYSDACLNSSGYDYSDDITVAQVYLNCICKNTAAIDKYNSKAK
jgi:hypothetical protein